VKVSMARTPLGEDGWSLAARLAVMMFTQLTEPAPRREVP
jgi:hypothetical protein